MKKYMCYCGREMDCIDVEWAKYGLSDCEELVNVYFCKKCKKKYAKREGNFDLEER